MDDFDTRPAPAPSYALESSDGESDWDKDELPLSARQLLQDQRSKPLPPDAVVEVRGAGDGLKQGGEVVWLVGEAGERVAQGVQLEGEVQAGQAQVFVDDEQVGVIYPTASGATLVFLSSSILLAKLHPLVSTLLDNLKPSTSTVLASYHLPSYIPSTEQPPSSPAPVLYLAAPSPSAAVSSLRDQRILSPFAPPNLLHGLASLIVMLSALSPGCSTTTALILPTTTPPQPLNGPFSPLSPITHGSAMTIYDAGGPTGLSDPGALFRELAAPRGPLRRVASEFGWGWWSAEGRGGKAYEWLEKQRRDRRREEVGSMYM
ncbi:hypothetical protein JCM10207_000939 [Rhodosporidiobolus poonsookiae]